MVGLLFRPAGSTRAWASAASVLIRYLLGVVGLAFLPN